MAQIEIGQLPLTTSIVNTTQIPVENANVTQKIEATALKDYVSSGLNVLSVSGNLTGANVVATQLFYGNLSTTTQLYITQLGNLTSITSNGNITTLSNVNVGGNVYASFVIGNGSLLTGLPAGYSNANVDAYLPTYTGNISAGNATIANTLVASGNVRVGQQLYVVGQSILESTTRVHGNLVAAAETLSTSATTGALVISGTGGLGVGGAVFVSGNINTNSNVNTGNVAGTKATFTSFQGSGALLTNIPNSALVNSAITVNGSSVSLGGSVTIANGVVVSVTGTPNQITANTAQGNIGLSLPQNIATTSNVRFGSIGIGVAAPISGIEVNGSINITAGTVLANTAAVKTNDTTMATTAFVDRLRSMLPQTTAAAGGTAQIGDRGCLLSITGGVTIPANIFSTNDTFSIYNNSASSITITQGASLTLRQVGTANTGNRTLAQRGLATVVFVSATEAVIAGGGLT